MAHLIIPSLSTEKDITWFTIAKDFGLLTYEWKQILFKTLNSYGFSHKMSKYTREINHILSVRIASTLDTMVCDNYPMTMCEITVDNISVPLTQLFYNFPNPDILDTNLSAYRKNKYPHTYSDDDREYIQNSIAHLNVFLIKINEIDLIKNDYYNNLTIKCKEIKKYLDKYEILFQNV